MRKYSAKLNLFVVPIFLVAALIITAYFLSSAGNKVNIEPHAASTSGQKTVCQEAGTGCDFVGATGLQQAIDISQDGDTINISAGRYSGPNAIPMGLGDAIFVSAGRGAADTCFTRIQNKNITINGRGATLYGEGHSDKANVAPYATRAGVCIVNSTVNIQGLHIKEFQKRCLVAYNSQVIIKNSTIDGCDEGGASLLGDSSGVFVNNMFAEMNFGGIMLWQNSKAVIVNNNFYNAALLFFYHPGTNDQARADIINNIFSEIKSDIAQVSWWKADPAQLKSSKLSYNIIYRSKDFVCDPGFELWCDNFPGKITADPLYTAPVTDPTGIAAWANFGFKDGSPAVGVGDPSIPGPKNLGVSGGPCVDPNSSICQSFIASAIVKPTSAPEPTSAEITPLDNNINPVSTLPPSNQTVPTPNVIYIRPKVVSLLPTRIPIPTSHPVNLEINFTPVKNKIESSWGMLVHTVSNLLKIYLP